MADPNKGLLVHMNDRGTPFTPPTTPRKVHMSIDSTLSNAYKQQRADAAKKGEPIDTTVIDKPALISPISPDFNIPVRPQEPVPNPGLVPDSADTSMEDQAADTAAKEQPSPISSLSPDFDTPALSCEPNGTPDLVLDSADGEDDEIHQWNEPDDDWGPMSQDSMEAFYLEHFASKEAPWLNDGDDEMDDDHFCNQFIEEYERHGLTDEEFDVRTQEIFKEYYFDMFRAEGDSEAEDWFLRVFGSRQPWISQSKEPVVDDLAHGDRIPVSA